MVTCDRRQHAAKQRAAATMHFQNKAVGRAAQDSHSAVVNAVDEAGHAEASQLAEAWMQQTLTSIRSLEWTMPSVQGDPSGKPVSEESDDTSDTSGTPTSFYSLERTVTSLQADPLPMSDVVLQSSPKTLEGPLAAFGERDRQQETLQKVSCSMRQKHSGSHCLYDRTLLCGFAKPLDLNSRTLDCVYCD
jgi:hypothetical protein